MFAWYEFVSLSACSPYTIRLEIKSSSYSTQITDDRIPSSNDTSTRGKDTMQLKPQQNRIPFIVQLYERAWVRVVDF